MDFLIVGIPTDPCTFSCFIIESELNDTSLAIEEGSVEISVDSAGQQTVTTETVTRVTCVNNETPAVEGIRKSTHLCV